MDYNNYSEIEIPKNQIKIETTRGSGNGGQHKNTTDSCVIMTHIPTGIKVVRDGRSQLSNRDEAYKELKRRANEFYKTGFINSEVENRKNQIGTGDRSIKKRTYRLKDDIVIDHETNQTCSFKEFSKGKIELLS
jgi:peptide chain release factor 1